MTILLYFILIGGLLIILSQSSYAYVIASVDFNAAERQVHCIHHCVHAICGSLAMLISASLLMGGSQIMTNATSIIAGLLLTSDAIAFLILNRTRMFTRRRDAIKHKWQGEKVFGPEHDHEVSVYRTLNEITRKNLLRDGLHLTLFAILYVISL